MDLNWPESGVSSCLGHHRLHRAPAPQSRVWPRLSEPRSGEQCACATRDTRNKNTGELETCTAGDYHMLAVIKTSSRNLWLADTGLTLDIRLPSLRFLHDLLRIWAAQPVFGLLCVKHLNTITIKYSPEQMLIINCTLAPGRDWDNFSLCLCAWAGPLPLSLVSIPVPSSHL